MDEKYIQMIIENNQSVKSAHHRIDKMENDIGEIKELTVAVKEIAMETKATREDVNDMNSRLKTVEEKPLKDYEETKKQVRNMILAFFGGIILTFIAIKLGLKDFI